MCMEFLPCCTCNYIGTIFQYYIILRVSIYLLLHTMNPIRKCRVYFFLSAFPKPTSVLKSNSWSINATLSFIEMCSAKSNFHKLLPEVY